MGYLWDNSSFYIIFLCSDKKLQWAYIYFTKAETDKKTDINLYANKNFWTIDLNEKKYFKPLLITIADVIDILNSLAASKFIFSYILNL